jgi:superfamily II DNA or RNA helicase
MQNEILEKLKIKRTPRAQEVVLVNIPTRKINVSVNTTVIDNTNKNDVDREDFLKNIKGDRRIFIKRAIKSATIPNAIVEDTDAGPANIIEAPPAKPSKIKKLKLKIKLHSNDPVVAPKMVVRKTKPPQGIADIGPITMVEINNETIANRIGPKAEVNKIRASAYYLNNRQIFVNFVTGIFNKYKLDIARDKKNASCEKTDSSGFKLMSHQKLVRDYISQYTPYRGVLLFHGLGSGKTCSSIAIAEGLKTSKQIIIMTPASLSMNYKEELKKCGDDMYKKNQFWEFVSTNNLGDKKKEIVDSLSVALSLSVDFINNQKGAWLMNVTKAANFDSLDSSQKSSLDKQLNQMINSKYKFINYNGLRNDSLRKMTNNYTINPFDNAVVIIDEAHNFIGRIVNKMGRADTLSGKMYEYLMNAHNAKMVLLTGTPIINKPNEIAILFNILRGKIKSWSFKLNIKNDKRVDKKYFEQIFNSKTYGGNMLDYIDYKPTSTTLIITRNPFGFVNKVQKDDYKGVHIGERGELTDEEFVTKITGLLSKKGFKVKPSDIKQDSYKALPDTLAEFKKAFVDETTNDVKNMNLFKRRILGLTSYFRDMESLMPRYNEEIDLIVVKIPMSDFQFTIYEEARASERKTESNNAKKQKKQISSGLFEESSSTYRIFSRAFCNFVFPRPHITRPLPDNVNDLESAILKEGASEDDIDAVTAKEKQTRGDEVDDIEKSDDYGSYQDRIDRALTKLQKDSDKYLTPDALEMYSPKFLNMLENIRDDETFEGLHLIYTQFRTLEGIGIFKLVLETDGFVQFKIKNVSGTWKLDIAAEDKGKKMFALYTGTETPEEKEIIRNVFNGDWEFLPAQLAKEVASISDTNMRGEIIKVLMITASGAEGISLKNVRYVHVTEPYWHPVRIQQVIGRARRICSHQALPKELQTVKVFVYLMEFTKEQIENDDAVELRIKDKSRVDTQKVLTSDEALFEISNMKKDITNKLLKAVKEASIDCIIHSSKDGAEQLQCFTFGQVDSTKFAYVPGIEQEENDTLAEQNKTTKIWRAKTWRASDGITYAVNPENNKVYDLESYKEGVPIQVGLLVERKEGNKSMFIFEKLVE